VVVVRMNIFNFSYNEKKKKKKEERKGKVRALIKGRKGNHGTLVGSYRSDANST